MRRPKITQSTVPWGLVLLSAASLLILIVQAILYSTAAMLPAQQDEQEAIMSYLHGPIFAENDLEFLPPDERAHMSDVKMLVDAGFLLSLAALGILLGVVGTLAWKRMWNALDELSGRAFILSGMTLLIAALIAGLAALLDFDIFWALFHAFLFPQGNWYFPGDSPLIQLYPPEFWQHAVFLYGIQIVLIAFLLVSLGIFMKRMRNASKDFKS